jgi:Circularly permutated YpsA SLOG family
MKFDLHWGGLHKVISGGQTGADQGGLMAAWRHGVETGGQAPAGYRVQNGYNPILEVLGLSQASDYAGRTRSNIANADGTVLLSHNMTSPGSMLTRNEAKAQGKPFLSLDILELVQLAIAGQTPENEEAMLNGVASRAKQLCEFILKHSISVLNVAGNREIKSDGKQHGTNIVTQITEWIIGMTIEVLETGGKVIYKKDKVDF